MSFDYEPEHYRSLMERHGLPEDVIDGVLCGHAHELAEKIRVERHNRYATGSEEEFWPADLIDPKGPRCTCGETACESELCDCDRYGCPAHDPIDPEVSP